MVQGIVRIVWVVAVVGSIAWAEAAPPAPKPASAHEPAPARPHEMKATVAVDGKVNINTASVKELMKLEGVNRKLAEKIVEYRDAHGHFKKATDIRKVEGFGGGLWDKNRERVAVE
jgi:competence protein ComEA